MHVYVYVCVSLCLLCVQNVPFVFGCVHVLVKVLLANLFCNINILEILLSFFFASNPIRNYASTTTKTKTTDIEIPV